MTQMWVIQQGEYDECRPIAVAHSREAAVAWVKANARVVVELLSGDRPYPVVRCGDEGELLPADDWVLEGIWRSAEGVRLGGSCPGCEFGEVWWITAHAVVEANIKGALHVG